MPNTGVSTSLRRVFALLGSAILAACAPASVPLRARADLWTGRNWDTLNRTRRGHGPPTDNFSGTCNGRQAAVAPARADHRILSVPFLFGRDGYALRSDAGAGAVRPQGFHGAAKENIGCVGPLEAEREWSAEGVAGVGADGQACV